MVMRIKAFISGFASAFDMSPAGYRQPSFLRAPRSDAEALAQDWKTLCSDGQAAVVRFETNMRSQQHA